jgi:glycosyltransferase 2 family protein
LDGLGGLADARTVIVVLGYSVYVWGVITLTFLFAFLAAGITVPLLPASLVTVVIVAACVFVPQGPGFIGTWQYGCVLALSVFHVADDVAVGYSVLTWLIQMVINLATAGVFLAYEGLSPAQLLRATATEAPEGTEA